MIDYWGHIIGVITVVLLLVFVGIWIWAWLPRHKAVFSRMARVPLNRDDRPDAESGDPVDEAHRTEDEGSKR